MTTERGGNVGTEWKRENGQVRFADGDIAKVMNRAGIAPDHLPSDIDAQEIVRAAIETGVLGGLDSFHVTEDGDYIAILEREPDGFACTATGPISTRYLWRSGLRGADAVRDMLRKVHDQVIAARTGTHPGAEPNG